MIRTGAIGQIMRMTLTPIVLALAVLADMGPAGAQTAGQSPPTASPAPPPSFVRPNIERRQAMELDRQFQLSSVRQPMVYQWAASFARCSANIGLRAVVGLLDQVPGSVSELEAARRITRILRVCSTGPYLVPVTALRGAMAEELVRRRGPVLSGPLSQTLDAVRYRVFEQTLPSPVGNKDAARDEMNRIARCQVVFATGLSRELLAQKIGSTMEKAALEKLYASVPVCGAMAVKPLASWQERAAIAEALYRWLKTETRPTETASWGRGGRSGGNFRHA